MKLLYFSSDSAEVRALGAELTGAGIPCEVRNGVAVVGPAGTPVHAEVWIENDQDWHQAFLLCVREGVGFAKRPHRAPVSDF